MNEQKVVPFNSSAALIEEAKKERQRLLDQIGQSQRTIEHSRQIIARIDEVLATADNIGLLSVPLRRRKRRQRCVAD